MPIDSPEEEVDNSQVKDASVPCSAAPANGSEETQPAKDITSAKTDNSSIERALFYTGLVSTFRCVS